MSYCRWSSMNWMCDVYVYEDCAGGWTTHVAGRRRMIPPIPDITGSRLSMAIHRWSGCDWDKETRSLVYPKPVRGAIYRLWSVFAVFWHNRIHMVSLRVIPLRNIGMPEDGETFTDKTPEECAGRLEGLMAAGYRVPQYAIDNLRAEVAGDAE